MRDPERIYRVMRLMLMIWRRHPDWRFGQLLYAIMSHMKDVRRFRQTYTQTINNATVEVPSIVTIDPFYLEDDGFEEELKKIERDGLCAWIAEKQSNPE